MARVVGAKTSERIARAVLPVVHAPAPDRVGEDRQEVVAAALGVLHRVAEHHLEGPVPGEVVPAAPEDAGRARPEVLDKPLDRGVERLVALLHRRDLVAAPEQHQVRMLRGVHLQRLRKRLEHLLRGAHLTALLEPRVPGGPHPRERGDLLAPQAGRAPPAAVGEPYVLWLERCTPPAQEVRELGAA